MAAALNSIDVAIIVASALVSLFFLTIAATFWWFRR